MSDSATKRKATGPPDTEAGSRSAKRQRIPGGGVETPDGTTEKGLKFVEAIKNAKDKTGRTIIDEFLTLPDPEEIPEYYEQIGLPIAVDIIEAKLNRREYPNLTALESDLKRLVQNAKDFNDTKSLIYGDAERVRKTASNWFRQHNPAYNDAGYVAKPTPLPGESFGTPMTPTPISLKITTKSAPSRTPAAKTNQLVDDAEEDGDEEQAIGLSDFTGKSFQDAQDQLINELIEYEDQGLQIFTPFHFLPPRVLQDYYQVIKYPVSLKAVQKRVRGQHGRGAATGASDFQSWDALEEELSYIWRNCREYNEDGSDMYNLAEEFEQICKQRVAVAKSQVEQPTQPKIKLNLHASNAPKQSIKLKFGSSKPSPGAQSPAGTPGADRSTPGMTFDSEALQRQKHMVAAGTNGTRPHSAAGRHPFRGSRSGSASTPIPSLNPTIATASPPAQPNGVKAESQHGQSPALSAIRPSTATSAPFTATALQPGIAMASRPASGSPHPQLQSSSNPGNLNHHPTHHHQVVNAFLQSKNRPAGQSVADSILPKLTISSHPGLPVSTPFKQVIKAHPRLIEQSFTFTVPVSKHCFHVVPYLPPNVTSRAYRIFVNVNGQRLSPQSRPGEEHSKSHPIYEARLERGGVSRIEVEVLAEKAGTGKGGKDEVDREKCTIFFHVMRS